MGKFKVSEIKIVIDRREKASWAFSIPTIPGTLSTGDYSIYGLEDYISIERKELGDLCNCLGAHRERFIRELERAKAFEYFGLIIEADFKTIRKGLYTSLIKSGSIIGSLFTFEHRYGIHVHFAGSHAHGAEICEQLLTKYVLEKQKILEKIHNV